MNNKLKISDKQLQPIFGLACVVKQLLNSTSSATVIFNHDSADAVLTSFHE